MTEKSGFVFVDLSAQQWGLYDNLPGAKKAGEALNVIVNAEIRDAFIAQSEGVPLHASAKKAMTAVQGFLRSIEGLGGNDGEPQKQVEHHVREILGDACLETPKSIEKASTFLKHSANDWNLFADKKGADEAAEKINQVFNGEMTKAFVAMSEGVPRHHASQNMREAIERVMEEIEGFGASDTEPLTVLAREMIFVMGESSEKKPGSAFRMKPG